MDLRWIVKILSGVLFLFSFSASAQHNLTSGGKLQLGLGFTPSLGFSAFIQDGFLPPGIALRPLGTLGGGLLLKQSNNKHFSFEAGAFFHFLGFKRVLTTHFQGNGKRLNQSIYTSSQTHLRIPVYLNYYFPGTKEHNWQRFIKFGTNIFIYQKEDRKFYSATRHTDPVTNDVIVESFSAELASFITPLLSLGIGIEKRFKNGFLLNGAFVSNQGFSNILVWDYTLLVDQKKYNNQVANKGSYLGVEINFYLPPFGSKNASSLK